MRSHAHLEYSQGFLVFDAEDTLSVWRVTGPDDGEDHRRGWFINIAELDCDQAMRGFQLDFPFVRSFSIGKGTDGLLGPCALCLQKAL